MDGDGCIDHNDLCGTFISLGEKVDEQAVRNMLAEVSIEQFNKKTKIYLIRVLKIY